MPEYPAWYESTEGPKISQTIFNLVATFVPVLDLVLLHFNIAIPGLSQTIQALIAAVVFVVFAVRAGVGYVKAKKILQARVATLAAQVRATGGVPDLGPGQLRI